MRLQLTDGEISISFQYDEDKIATRAILRWTDPKGNFKKRIIPYLTYRKQQVFEEWDLAKQRRQERMARRLHQRYEFISQNLRDVERADGSTEFEEYGLALLSSHENYNKMVGRKYALRYALENAGFDKSLRTEIWETLVSRGMNLSREHRKEKQRGRKLATVLYGRVEISNTEMREVVVGEQEFKQAAG